MATTIPKAKDGSPFGEDEMVKGKAYAPRLESLANKAGKLTDELAYVRSQMRAEGLDDRKACQFYGLGDVLAGSDYKVPFAAEAMELTLQDAAERGLKTEPTVPNFKLLGTAKELKSAIALAKERTSATGPGDLPPAKAGEMLQLIKAGEKPKPKPKPKGKGDTGKVSAQGRIESDIANSVGSEELDWDALRSIVALCERHIAEMEAKA
mgnify:CR=1 FL=1